MAVHLANLRRQLAALARQVQLACVLVAVRVVLLSYLLWLTGAKRVHRTRKGLSSFTGIAFGRKLRGWGSTLRQVRDKVAGVLTTKWR